jgi:hypothetical protein
MNKTNARDGCGIISHEHGKDGKEKEQKIHFIICLAL